MKTERPRSGVVFVPARCSISEGITARAKHQVNSRMATADDDKGQAAHWQCLLHVSTHTIDTHKCEKYSAQNFCVKFKVHV